MIYREEQKDLFTVSKGYFLAHCISADAKMGAGIAVEFKLKFNLSMLEIEAKKNKLQVGSCVKTGQVFNLITKEKYWHKPTYETFAKSLYNLKQLVIRHNVKKIAMPKIGAGLDKLNWERNRDIIRETFFDTDIEILVCYQ